VVLFRTDADHWADLQDNKETSMHGQLVSDKTAKSPIGQKVMLSSGTSGSHQ
jgi:hypothetical protein